MHPKMNALNRAIEVAPVFTRSQELGAYRVYAHPNYIFECDNRRTVWHFCNFHGVKMEAAANQYCGVDEREFWEGVDYALDSRVGVHLLARHASAQLIHFYSESNAYVPSHEMKIALSDAGWDAYLPSLIAAGREALELAASNAEARGLRRAPLVPYAATVCAILSAALQVPGSRPHCRVPQRAVFPDGWRLVGSHDGSA